MDGNGGVDMFIKAEDQMWLNTYHIIQFQIYQESGEYKLRAYMTDQTWELVGIYDKKEDALNRLYEINMRLV